LAIVSMWSKSGSTSESSFSVSLIAL